MKAYRGGCTDKYWSNTTACPDWCNDGKHDAYSAILTCRLSRRSHKKKIKANNFSDSVHPHDSANIFRCPKHVGFYCDQSLSTACQGSEIEVQTYTSATILGTPPISSIEQIATANPSTLTTATSVTESIASSTFKNTPTCTQIIHQSSLRATAIGIGLGAPCGIAAIGFLVFLFWRDAKRKISRSPKQDILGDQRARRHNTLTGGEMDGNGPQLELPGTMITAELHGNEMVQQPNGTAPLAVEPIQTFTLGDRPLD